MNRETADLVCRALLAIVAALRKAHGLPEYRGIIVLIEVRENPAIASQSDL